MTTKKLLGAKIKEIRKKRELSQEKIAEQVGIDPKHFSRIEVGVNYPSLNTLEKIAQSLNVEIEDLFNFHHIKNNLELMENITILLKEADEAELQLIYKIVRDIVR